MNQPTKTTKLYKNTVTIDFYEKYGRYSHIYIKRETNEWPISVTGATSIVDKSRPLIFWAVGLMRDHLLEIVENGKAILSDNILEASKLHQQKKEEAANKGSEVHNWIEQYINSKLKKNTEKPTMPKDEQILNGVLAFLDWEKQHKVKFLATEKLIYSKKHNYVGLMDAKAKIDGRVCVVDFKTSSGLYNEMRYQVAAYQGADEEETGEQYTGNRWLIRFDKNTAEFEAHELADFKKDYKTFIACLEVRRREKELQKCK
ncbi:MAG TPA: hypothetical protein PKZ42_01670 [Syntrophales bacterium]|nr:hypothetical protein [Syntrophales bacterium]